MDLMVEEALKEIITNLRNLYPIKKMKIYGKRLVRLVIIVSQSTKGANPYKPR